MMFTHVTDRQISVHKAACDTTHMQCSMRTATILRLRSWKSATRCHGMMSLAPSANKKPRCSSESRRVDAARAELDERLEVDVVLGEPAVLRALEPATIAPHATGIAAMLNRSESKRVVALEVLRMLGKSRGVSNPRLATRRSHHALP